MGRPIALGARLITLQGPWQRRLLKWKPPERAARSECRTLSDRRPAGWSPAEETIGGREGKGHDVHMAGREEDTSPLNEEERSNLEGSARPTK